MSPDFFILFFFPLLLGEMWAVLPCILQNAELRLSRMCSVFTILMHTGCTIQQADMKVGRFSFLFPHLTVCVHYVLLKAHATASICVYYWKLQINFNLCACMKWSSLVKGEPSEASCKLRRNEGVATISWPEAQVPHWCICIYLYTQWSSIGQAIF